MDEGCRATMPQTHMGLLGVITNLTIYTNYKTVVDFNKKVSKSQADRNTLAFFFLWHLRKYIAVQAININL